MTFYFGDEPLTNRLRLIRAGGELDLAAAPELRERMSAAIDEGATRLVLDFTDVTFVDSTTVGALVTAARRLRSRDGSLTVACTNPNVLRIFEIVGLDRVVSVVGSADETPV